MLLVPLFWWRARRIAPGPAHAANALLAMLMGALNIRALKTEGL
jgi:predicted signal transduction protein with EAL and GGDEF domain